MHTYILTVNLIKYNYSFYIHHVIILHIFMCPEMQQSEVMYTFYSYSCLWLDAQADIRKPEMEQYGQFARGTWM